MRKEEIFNMVLVLNGEGWRYKNKIYQLCKLGNYIVDSKVIRNKLSQKLVINYSGLFDNKNDPKANVEKLMHHQRIKEM